MLNKRKIKKFLGELALVSDILSGLIGIFFFLWFFDMHTIDITITRQGPLFMRNPFHAQSMAFLEERESV